MQQKFFSSSFPFPNPSKMQNHPQP